MDIESNCRRIADNLRDLKEAMEVLKWDMRAVYKHLQNDDDARKEALQFYRRTADYLQKCQWGLDDGEMSEFLEEYS
jgi:DNA anti-recombination protein RmuC